MRSQLQIVAQIQLLLQGLLSEPKSLTQDLVRRFSMGLSRNKVNRPLEWFSPRPSVFFRSGNQL